MVAPPLLESEGVEIEMLKGGCPPTPCSESSSVVECGSEYEAAVKSKADPSRHYICAANSVARRPPSTNADSSIGQSTGSGIVSVIVKNGVPAEAKKSC